MSQEVSAGWTDLRVETLKTLWADGLSAGEIAKRLRYVTRNAVIGKVHRLGLARRATASAPRQTAPKERRVRMARFIAPKVALPKCEPVAEIPDGPGTATLLTLGRHMCKWPIGDPLEAGFTLCGRRSDAGPYCAGHAERARDPAANARTMKRAAGNRSEADTMLRALQRWL